MAKTYVLQSTSMNGGQTENWTNDIWNYYANDNTGIRIGKYLNRFRATNILFDPAVLAQLRSKTVISIKLTLWFYTSYAIYKKGTTTYPIGYKLNSAENSASNAWMRSNADSTDAEAVTIGYLTTGTNSNESVAEGGSYTFDLSDGEVPVYGYVIGTTSVNNGGNYRLLDGATLTVVTSETDYTHTLSYNANGGSGAPASQSQTQPASSTPTMVFAIPETEPTRSGYRFLGWGTSADDETASYQPGGSISISRNTTLYAIWEQVSYTISYKKGAYGTGTNTSDVKNPGASISLRNAIFTRDGYTQQGWSTSDGGAKVYNLGASYSADADVTLYPYWVAVSPEAVTIKVYIKLNGEMVELLSAQT